MSLTFGSLFAGIGGLDLGLERAGLACRWQVEIDPYCRSVLARHWPEVRRHDDVRTFPPGDPGDWAVDVVAGGFPCQDLSSAGKRRGIKGKSSGLWTEFERVVRALEPAYVLVENVDDLRVRGMGSVLGDLARLGYDAEWESLPASAFGAPHGRSRMFILAYSHGQRRPAPEGIPRSSSERLAAEQAAGFWVRAGRWEPGHEVQGRARWLPFAPVLRELDGLPSGLDKDRVQALGNAVVPQVAEFLGRLLIELHERMEVA